MGDSEFTALLHEYAGLLSRIASSYEAEPSLRDDLLQDIALALWKAVPSWRGDASLKTFVARVAHNRGVTHVIKATRQPPLHVLDVNTAGTGQGPELHAQMAQKRQHLQDAVRALPLALRQVVTLALEGFTHREIGAALGISASNVAVRLHRARTAMKKTLGEFS